MKLTFGWVHVASVMLVRCVQFASSVFRELPVRVCSALRRAQRWSVNLSKVVLYVYLVNMHMRKACSLCEFYEA